MTNTAYTFLLIFTALTSLPFCFKTPKPKRLTVLTLNGGGSNRKSVDALDRLRRNGQLNNLKLKILQSPDQLNSKVDLLWQELRDGGYSEDEDDVILFTESHNILLLGQADEILNRFEQFQVDILLANQNQNQNQNPDLFIGYRSHLLEILDKSISNYDLNLNSIATLILNYCIPPRENGTIELTIDTQMSLFHLLQDQQTPLTNQSKLVVMETGSFLIDSHLNKKILIVHSQTPTPKSQLTLNMYENNLLNWQPGIKCKICLQDTINLKNVVEVSLPSVTLAIFIETPTPFLEEFFEAIQNLDYPKSKIYFFIYNHVPFHSKLVDLYLTQWSSHYVIVHQVNLNGSQTERILKPADGRQLAVNFALDQNSDYFFSIDSKANLDNPSTLKKLIEQNRGVVAPLLVIPYTLVSNFWAALDLQGFYDRSKDYAHIVKGKRRGLWNVPFITGAYLVHKNILRNENLRPNFTGNFPTPDLAFCWHQRKNGVFIHLNNQQDWGHLINADSFSQDLTSNPSRVHHELYQFFSNQFKWEKRYMNPDWSKSLEFNHIPAQPCPDVFAFPLVTRRFCSELIHEMEMYGNWSGTNDYDIDPAPTADITLDQIDLEEHWIEFVKRYVIPLQELVYPHYSSRKIKWDIPYVIRYHADGRKILNPHHDKSTYTVNVALNTAGLDFEGGGVRFNRYNNCDVFDRQIGWVLLHPGQLTHQHQGLVVTKGRRYVLITFINPH